MRIVAKSYLKKKASLIYMRTVYIHFVCVEMGTCTDIPKEVTLKYTV